MHLELGRVVGKDLCIDMVAAKITGEVKSWMSRSTSTQIKQAVKKLYDTDVTKLSTRSDLAEEKAYVQVASCQDALDAANKIGII
ncbi:60S ribosomal protein L23a [Heterocephalus glaber]|uniref:60S ribosomal protein L23a n=1 Tax=Heterocephalus glaber TaxID=10181 RepID=G5BGS2_HETGA|nr:60S ribosomal protein L23a [Heterocephalus glaber]